MDKYLSALKVAKSVYEKLVKAGNDTARDWFDTFTSGICEVIIQDDTITGDQFGDFLEIKNSIIKQPKRPKKGVRA